MRTIVRGALVLAVGVVAGACSSDGMTAPSPGGATQYDGQWSGSTSQGRAVAFTVSPDQKVVSITLGLNVNGCAGTVTFPNLSLPIASPPALPTGSPPLSASAGPGFGYVTGRPDEPNFVQVSGFFTSARSASGVVAVGQYQGCGDALFIWDASRR